jgi:alpha-L-rhamnosidase
MNSFSHYAFGAAMEWAYSALAGIAPLEPGYRRILIHPRPSFTAPREGTPAITWVRAHHDAAPGRIATAWRINGNRFELDLTVPPNTRAEVRLPTPDAASVTEGGQPVTAVAGLTALAPIDGEARLEVPAGRYHFIATLPLRTAHP